MVEFLQYAQERKRSSITIPNFRKAHAHEAIRLMPTVLENLEFADIVRGSDEDFQNLYGEETTSTGGLQKSIFSFIVIVS